MGFATEFALPTQWEYNAVFSLELVIILDVGG
jgi:hypothetical protein